jgi:tRNA-2-methylthio-N6-dimethylallyladenosine synthase
MPEPVENKQEGREKGQKKLRVLLRTFGCQMNARDSEVIKGVLLAKGYKIAESPEEADIILFNTCSVRQHAEDKVWSQVGQYKARGPQQKMIGVMGCMAQSYQRDILKRAPHVDIVCGPSHIDDIALYLEEALRTKKPVVRVEAKERREEVYRAGFYEEKNHAYAIISEGCDNYCSYCVVPYVRGRLRHRECGAILDEVTAAVEAGIAHITLLGQNVNAYTSGGPKSRVDFVTLLKRVSAVKGLKSLSFVTCHPKDTTREFFEILRDIPVIKKALHMPLQSGSDRILKLMNRGYTVKKYMKLVDLYRQLVYNAQLSTDIITGFPGETDDDHRKTLELLKKVCFDAAYIFKYSSRPHTKAALLADDVGQEIKERRHAELLKTQKDISKKLKMKDEKLKKILSFGSRALAFVAVFLLMSSYSWAQDSLAEAHALFLKKQYWQTIEACTESIRKNPGNIEVLSESNYLAGASYVNLFDFLTAKKSFKVVVDKYKGSAYYEDAYLALGDVELLQENTLEALRFYTEFYVTNPSKKRLATLYFRLAEVNLKLGHQNEYKKYFDKLQQEFPLSFEARDARRLRGQDVFYTVQVGAFTNYENAEKFIAQLKVKGYEVYSVLCMLSGKKLCRVRIGKFRTRAEAQELKKKLELDGYFAKIFP